MSRRRHAPFLFSAFTLLANLHNVTKTGTRYDNDCCMICGLRMGRSR
jgi:hypothetical protein